MLNEAVYNKSARQLEPATRATSALQRMAKITGAPLTGQEAGGLTATCSHVLNAPAERVMHLNAIVARGSVLGGNRMDDVARSCRGSWPSTRVAPSATNVASSKRWRRCR